MGGDKDPRVHPGQSLEMYRFVKIRWMDHYLKAEGGEPPPYELDHAKRLESEL